MGLAANLIGLLAICGFLGVLLCVLMFVLMILWNDFPFVMDAIYLAALAASTFVPLAITGGNVIKVRALFESHVKGVVENIFDKYKI